MEFKRVPALDKGFSILDLFAKEKRALGISEISNALNLNKSTVYNIIHTLVDIGVLENLNGKFSFGPKLYILGKAAEKNSELIQIIHPYIEEIRNKTDLTTFLGMRSGMKVIILDKADSTFDLKVSSEIGIRIPLLAGAHGKAILSQKPDKEINKILLKAKLKPYTKFACTDKKKYLDLIKKVREAKIAVEKEEYIEGIRALAVPLPIKRFNLHMALWAVGLKTQIKDQVIPFYGSILKNTAQKIENRFS